MKEENPKTGESNGRERERIHTYSQKPLGDSRVKRVGWRVVERVTGMRRVVA